MKACFYCNTAKRIVRSYYTEEDGKVYKVLVYACMNPSCENYKKEEKVKQRIEILKGE